MVGKPPGGGATRIRLSRRQKHSQGADCETERAFLNVELRGAGFGDGLHVGRQLLLHGAAGTAIPLHYLHAAASVAAVEDFSLVLSIRFITGRFKDRQRAPTECFEGTTLVEGQLTVRP